MTATRGRTVAGTMRSAAFALMQVPAALKDRVRPPQQGVTILIYHRVGARTSSLVDLPTGQFAEQMARVADVATTLDTALDSLAAGGDGFPSQRNQVVVTFDDGTADIIEEALPICVEHRVPLLLYLATRFVDEKRQFPQDGHPVSWSALADGLTTGYLEIGSHTHGHALLDRIRPADVDTELDRSVELIQDRLGVDPVHFAYPKALPGNAAADRAVRARFRSAALDGSRANVPGATDPWALARTPIQVTDTMHRFDAKVAGRLGLEDDVRRMVNRIRYRGDST